MGIKKKIRVALIYGGRSGEHQISLRSAASVLRHLDRDMFDIVPIAIDLEGRWHLQPLSSIDPSMPSLPVLEEEPQVLLPTRSGSLHQKTGQPTLIFHPDQPSTKRLSAMSGMLSAPIDVIFPIMHGPLCEDGTIQGLFQLADIPYVGCGVLASAIAMDKDMTKRVLRDAGLPIVPYLTVKSSQWTLTPENISAHIQREVQFPCFVKPANLGSSVGVSKVKHPQELAKALALAFQYDEKVLVEQAISAREIEIAVLEGQTPGQPPRTSVIGEIIPHHEFYSYEAKYIDEHGATCVIPASLHPSQQTQVKQLAESAFQAVEAEGMARIDFFLDRKSGEFFINELNTIPGFTSISMYPKLWEASGLSMTELLTELIVLALNRQQRKNALRREFSPPERENG